MVFSFNSLNNFINLSTYRDKLNELVAKISARGFEVESFEKKSLPHVVIAEVLTRVKHPQADRLSLCQVRSGPSTTHSIVCGASNYGAGDKVVLALPGAKLPGDFKIKVSKIRGEKSEGMLTSLSELKLSAPESKDEGIIVLPQDAPLGEHFDSYIGLKDILFDIDITPNRADCLSHMGFARELACILNLEFRKSKTPSLKGKGPSLKKKLDLEIKQPELCPRYTGRALYGVEIKDSPLWLRVCLENLGFNSINNVVDITNYFLIKWGQPLHAFDLDRLQNKILVDFSKKEEKFKTLKGEYIELTGEELCIRDEAGALALAGVIGGMGSEVKKETKNIFLEAACFKPSQVRKTSKRFGIETDSSYRFSRGVPVENTLEMLNRALRLIQEIAGGECSSDTHDATKKPPPLEAIKIQKKDLERRLDMPCSFKKFETWMRSLGCVVKIKGRGASVKALVYSPYFRFDLNIKEDLIEEYARLEGYDKIPEKINHLSRFPIEDQKEFTQTNKWASILAHQGFYQAINHSFISEEFSKSFIVGTSGAGASGAGASGAGASQDQDLYGKLPVFLQPASDKENRRPIFIQNPLSAEHNMMRVSLIPSLFKNAQQSWRHGSMVGRLFEIGRVFYSENLGEIPQYKESTRLGLVAWGQEENLWNKQQQGRACIYDLKTAIESFFLYLNISDYEWVLEKSAPNFIHPYQYQVLKLKDQAIAYIGTLNPLYAEAHKIRVDMALAEMDLEPVFKTRQKKLPFQKLSPFPAVERDLSFLIPKDFPAGNMIKGIKKIAGSVCREVRIFDVYENKQTHGEELRSVAFRLTLQSDHQTLTEEDLKKLQDRLTRDLIAQYPCKLRS